MKSGLSNVLAYVSVPLAAGHGIASVLLPSRHLSWLLGNSAEREFVSTTDAAAASPAAVAPVAVAPAAVAPAVVAPVAVDAAVVAVAPVAVPPGVVAPPLGPVAAAA